MPTECSVEKFEFGAVSGRVVVAGFDGGATTPDGGSLLLGTTNRTIRLTECFAACFTDRRSAHHIEHDVQTLLMQRAFGIALGYEDQVDHDQLRHDAVLAALAGKLAARHAGCCAADGQVDPEPAEAESPKMKPPRRWKWKRGEGGGLVG